MTATLDGEIRCSGRATRPEPFYCERAHAESAGFVIDDVVSDNSVSGVNTRLADRPEGKRLFDKLRAGDVLVVRWVDRLGRNYDDVCAIIRAFMARGVDPHGHQRHDV